MFLFSSDFGTKFKYSLLILCVIGIWAFPSIDTTVLSRFVAVVKQNNNQTLMSDSADEFNIVYIKVPKVGGSTVGGVMRRIGTKFNLSGTRDKHWIKNEPGVWANHGSYKALRKKISRLKKNTLLITWMREPVERMLSQFYFHSVSRRNITPTDNNIIKSLKAKNYQIKFIATNDMCIDDITERYDFIGITDRFAESMLVLACTLKLNLEDILYLNAKDSHHLQTDDKGNKFVPSVPASQQSTKVKQFINKKVKKNNAKEYELWNTVNKKMDLAIQNIPNFNEKLKHYKEMLSKADTKCKAQQENINDCYWNDNGCGVSCLNSILYP